MKDYGMTLYRNGAIFHGDGRKRWPGVPNRTLHGRRRRGTGPRGSIKAFSHGSRRRLEFLAANVEACFKSHLTLTYHANVESWETDADRNGRVAARSKRDLNRFLSTLRDELGAYLWVQEFQARGVIHYHMLCTGDPGDERISIAWCRATDALEDVSAVRHATRVQRIENERAARGYVGRYVGKARQKVLPAGVGKAGRWWGRSRSLHMVQLDEVVAGEAGIVHAIPEGARIVRCLRRYVSKVFGFKFRSGRFVDWRGELSIRLKSMTVTLRDYFGTPRRMKELVADHGWVEVEGRGDDLE